MTILTGDCRHLMPAHGPFDLVLADPPYGRRWPQRLLGLPEIERLLVPRGALVLERSVREPAGTGTGTGESKLSLLETKRYGETCFDLYEPTEGLLG